MQILVPATVVAGVLLGVGPIFLIKRDEKRHRSALLQHTARLQDYALDVGWQMFGPPAPHGPGKVGVAVSGRVV